MRKTLISFILLLAVSKSVSAQNNQPEVGVIDKADLLMQDCDFDKNAEALKLIDWGKVQFEGSGWNPIIFGTAYERRVRTKILKEKGLNQANVKIQFIAYENYEQILKVEAYTYNLDLEDKIRITKVDKSSIYRKKINEGISELIIVFPEVKVGSVIEFRYRLERGGNSYINDWDFQYNIPVRFSEYQVEMPTYLHFKEKIVGNAKLETSELSAKEAYTINPASGVYEPTLRKVYSMQNIPALKEEPFMGGAEDYRQKVEFLLTQVGIRDNEYYDMRTSWSTVVNDLMSSEYFGKQIEGHLPNTFNLVTQWKKIADLETRVKTIYTYVQQHMNWNEREIIICYDGVKNAFENKTGSNADINLVLLNLLKQADVQSYPILFSTRNNGLVNTMYPIINQFNTVMAYVPVGDKFYILDATDKTAWFKMIPAEVVNTNGFLMQGANGKWIEVLESKLKYKVFTAIRSEIDTNGKMLGEATINCAGYAKKERIKIWLKDRDAFKNMYFSEPGISLNIEDIVINNINIDSLPLEQKIKFSSSLNSTGDYTFFKINMFSGLGNNPFVNEQRISDIDYGYLQDYTIVGSYIIPDGFICDSLPENISLQMPDKSIVFNRIVITAGNHLNVRLTLKFENSYYLVTNYPEFKEFNKKLYAVLNEHVVIKKKS